jgi:hypothetical protein
MGPRCRGSSFKKRKNFRSENALPLTCVAMETVRNVRVVSHGETPLGGALCEGVLQPIALHPVVLFHIHPALFKIISRRCCQDPMILIIDSHNQRKSYLALL